MKLSTSLLVFASVAAASTHSGKSAVFERSSDAIAAAAGVTVSPPQTATSESEPCRKDSWAFCLEEYRRQVVIRSSADDTDDISESFLAGVKQANNGGVLVLEKGKKYVIGQKLNLTGLNNIYVRMDGEIKFTDDIAHWQVPENHFYYDFQKSITFWVWGGQFIRIFGSGTMNGNGQAWYDGFAGKEILDSNNTYLRPILFMTDNATRISVSGIKFLNSPCWTTFLVRTKDISFDRIRIDAHSANANLPKNTDGFDSYNVDGLSVTNSEINVGDDCFSPKPNTTNIHVENLTCWNTHGVSMGSIGQYPGVMDYISNAYIKNVTLHNATIGARLKAWAGKDVGYGYMKNITYEDIHVDGVDMPIVLDQCYFGVDAATCKQYPSKVDIENVKFINITGSSSGKEGRKVAELKCSPGADCKNISMEGVNISSPKGEAQVVCDNIQGGIGVSCVNAKGQVISATGEAES